ncbi:hypothetical protein TVAG_436150 [Trichomonas vaginalis G3]|uniref:Uncharacterized protein n=1 Tax=Trichomonas vaginalis (strain ATCC PRA-98 / G3) TaxID=412133 RepID=A2G543_TRIV3|nr:spectrin binding [Trichomonas vaginalis G3]EAX87723.1 hypothetical protein TVAG_436150 [Trichomonas vaginalis G3]KAI5545976.1 spectrin binding [Trichomonas vaginalis G3]|eukprot:XP_001300653.1 hypothetical protein [Trichomonas vaginalis G3]
MEFMDKSFSEAIINGNNQSIAKLVPEGSEINKCFHGEFKIKSKSKKNVFPFITDPTPIVLCILCEQSQTLKYLLEKYKVDLFQYVGEWAPIHYACCTESYECLAIMLKNKSFQQKIDIPILSSINETNDFKTTALHVAVTNKRYSQVILLTQNLIYAKATTALEFLNQNIPTISHIDQKSMSGNTALHIAVYLKDLEMCKILISGEANPNIENDENISPLAFAKNHNYSEILSVLRNNLLYSRDYLLQKYFSKEFLQEYKIDCDVPIENQLKAKFEDLQSEIIDISAQLSQLESKL